VVLINTSLSNVAADWLTIAESRRSDRANGIIHTETTISIKKVVAPRGSETAGIVLRSSYEQIGSLI
jgi:hypothetical protein